jgi:hypothetical protein
MQLRAANMRPAPRGLGSDASSIASPPTRTAVLLPTSIIPSPHHLSAHFSRSTYRNDVCHDTAWFMMRAITFLIARTVPSELDILDHVEKESHDL